MAYAAHDMQDTITALATAPGRGAIAVIRLSGPRAIEIVDALFPAKALAQQPSHTAHYGSLRDADGHIVDEVVLTLFKGPHSYTGEDTVEVSCHGSPYIVQQLLQLFVQQGARPAQAGEFTLRAFLHGKMDLSQAEAVADLIASGSEAAHRVAIQQMRGGFSNDIQALRQQLIDFASLIELELDFGEEDVEFANREELRTLVEQIRSVLQELMQSFSLGNAIKEGITTVIAGRPNAGKSTLLNALLNEDRAIVSDIAGTTRDTIEEVLHIQGIPFRIIDTAGLREAQDAVEAIGVEKTLEKVAQSSLLVYVFDILETKPTQVREDLRQLARPGLHILVVANKMDLNPYTKYEHYFGSSPGPSSPGGENSLRPTVSAPPPSEEGPGEEQGKWMTASPRTYKLLKARARELRKNLTPAEAALWPHLRRRQIEDAEFRRQHVVGHFIPDFLNLEYKLIIEVDGGYHQLPEVQLRDEERSQILTAAGYTILRFSNEEVLYQLDEVLAKIQATLIRLDEASFATAENSPAPLIPPDAWVPIVAKEGMNIPYLKEKLYTAVLDEKVEADQTVVSNARHYAALEASHAALSDVLQGMSQGVTADFVAMDIRRALHHLGEITGEISTDDLLENIFGRFCIGK